MKPRIQILLVILLIFISVMCLVFIDTKESEEDTLIFSTVLFRHGERTPSFNYTFPNDPHQNNTYYPYGLGQMTTEGKRTMFKVGKQLRKRYASFLGDIYSDGLIYALSSHYERTRMSLQIVLTAMFPPTEPYIIDPEVKWQPVSFDYIKKQDDDMLSYWGKCTDFLDDVIEKYFETDHVKKVNAEAKYLYKYISEHSGLNLTSVFWASRFYSNFKGQIAYGLEIPEWAKKVYPQPLELYFKEEWKGYAANFTARKYASGRLLKVLADTSNKKIKGDLPLKKMNIYSGHDYGISGLLAVLRIPHDYKLPYGAYLLFELHKIDGIHGIKVFYQDHSSVEPVLKFIGDCGTFCPLEKFIELTQEYFPNPNICVD